jgi:hypothetical protein
VLHAFEALRILREVYPELSRILRGAQNDRGRAQNDGGRGQNNSGKGFLGMTEGKTFTF